MPVSLSSTYTDVRGLQSLPEGDAAALRKAASEFESMFLDIWLKSMREANAVFSEGSYLSSSAVEMHQEMLDHQWAVHMSNAGGIGLGDVLVDQLSSRAGAEQGATDTRAPSRTSIPAMIVPTPDTEGEQTVPLDLSAVIPVVKPQGGHQPLFDTAQEFVERLKPVVERMLGNTPINPVNVIAQAALETGWGQKIIHDANGKPSFNLFGIKAQGWSGDRVEVTTLEQEFGALRPRRADFRSYSDLGASVSDYVRLLKERYVEATQTGDDALRFGNELQKAGYATDPDYGRKIESVAARVRSLLETL